MIIYNHVFLFSVGSGSGGGFVASYENTQEQRRHRVDDTCDRLPMDPMEELNPRYFDHLIVDDERKLIYCHVPRVAGTNWKSTLVYSGRPYKEMHQQEFPAVDVSKEMVLRQYGLSLLSDYTIDGIRQRLDSYFKFLFVRHPLKRVISAYWDKFTHKDQYTEYFHLKYGKQIMERYRGGQRSGVKDEIQFHEFIQYLIDTAADGGEFDEHWATVQELCHPCVIDYDCIGKLENITTDSRCVLERLSTDPMYFPHPRDSALTSTSDGNLLIQLYYQNISQPQMELLRDIYSVDCEMFGYNCERVS